MIKLLAVDMDGTCLNSKSQMSEKTVSALRLAAEKGITVVPTTGRNLSCIPHRLKNEKFYRYAITSNGACVNDLKENKKIYESLISDKTAIEILKKCHKNGFGITAQIDGNYYLQGRLLSLAGRIYYGKDSKNSICIKNIEQFVDSHKKDVEEIQLYFLGTKAKETAKNILSEFDTVSAAYSSIYVEIFDKNASKGTALSKLAEHLGINKEEIVCIGDAENDLTMFASSGTRFAMGNAVESLKEKADFILPDNNSDGVAFAIENYIL